MPAKSGGVHLSSLPTVTPEMRTWKFWVKTPSSVQDPVSVQARIRGGLDNLGERSSSSPPDLTPPQGFLANGQAWSPARWMAMTSQARAAEPVLEYGFTVTRASLRSWPTHEACYRHADDREFDQFQETRVHLFEPLVVTARSQDGRWCWVRSEIAAGWMSTSDLALTSRETWTDYRDRGRPHVTIWANGVRTEPQPYDALVSNRPLEFACRLPLRSSRLPSDIGHQHPLGHYVVELPVREDDGRLSLRPALIKRGDSVQEGYLPCSRTEVARSAFRLLGDRYAWGDLIGTHDCSSLVMDVYRTLGIQLPRNSAVQAKSLPSMASWTKEDTEEKRLSDLKMAKLGDILTMPGHVMLFLGFDQGDAYAIHAFVGYGERSEGGINQVWVNAVEVSNLAMLTRSGTSYLQQLTGVLPVL